MLIDITGFAKTDHIMSQLANSILLAQPIATLIHYPCIVLMGLVDWSAFLELVLLTM